MKATDIKVTYYFKTEEKDHYTIMVRLYSSLNEAYVSIKKKQEFWSDLAKIEIENEEY